MRIHSVCGSEDWIKVFGFNVAEFQDMHGEGMIPSPKHNRQYNHVITIDQRDRSATNEAIVHENKGPGHVASGGGLVPIFFRSNF